MDCSTPGFPVLTISWSLLKLMSIESVMPFNHFVLCWPLLLLPSIFPRIRVFSNELALHIRWPKFWSLSFSISPSNEYSGLISFKNDWLDLLADQGTFKSLLQPHTAQKHQFFGALPSLWSNFHICTWLQISINLSSTITTIPRQSFHHPHFINGDTGPQRGEVIYPVPHSWVEVKLEYNTIKSSLESRS